MVAQLTEDQVLAKNIAEKGQRLADLKEQLLYFQAEEKEARDTLRTVVDEVRNIENLIEATLEEFHTLLGYEPTDM